MSVAPTEIGLRPSEGGRGYRAEALVSLVRLRWFIHLRWLMLLCTCIFLALERWSVGEWARPSGLTWILLVLLAVNLFWWGFSRFLLGRIEIEGENEASVIRVAVAYANAQIGADLLLLTGILRYTGGVENPMAIFYLFHMAIAPLLLTTWQAFLQSVWAFVLYCSMCFGELLGWLTPHYCFLPFAPGPALYANSHYVCVMVVVVGSGIFGTLYFTRRIVGRLDERERVLRNVNAALRKSQAAIQELQRRKSQFMKTAAHQLKSPLAIIQTQVNLLRDGLVPAESQPKIFDKVIVRCRTAIGQVADLLTYARIQDADPWRHRESRADVAEVVRDLCEQHEPLVESKKLEFACEVPRDGDWTVLVDPRDLADAIGNLIDNAIRFTESGGKISVKVARAGDSVSVLVQDTGMGMPLETQREMFDAYRRGNLALEAGILGSGLGLSIVREVIEQAGGEIIVRSRPNEGSTFTILLPAGERPPGGPRLRSAGASVIRIE
ncbi:MAG: HAMP domain-containing histidine kinase [Phycisphaerae bacterium]|nr:HAMP domain-containing histidine kinase [Phycisphaerae bacterium]